MKSCEKFSNCGVHEKFYVKKCSSVGNRTCTSCLAPKNVVNINNKPTKWIPKWNPEQIPDIIVLQKYNTGKYNDTQFQTWDPKNRWCWSNKNRLILKLKKIIRKLIPENVQENSLLQLKNVSAHGYTYAADIILNTREFVHTWSSANY